MIVVTEEGGGGAPAERSEEGGKLSVKTRIKKVSPGIYTSEVRALVAFSNMVCLWLSVL